MVNFIGQDGYTRRSVLEIVAQNASGEGAVPMFSNDEAPFQTGGSGVLSDLVV
jgi:hypothetical protein